MENRDEEIDDSKYGRCECCNCEMEPVWFIEEETQVLHGIITYTGRKRRAVDYLECNICGKKNCVDDSFDGNWYS